MASEQYEAAKAGSADWQKVTNPVHTLGQRDEDAKNFRYDKTGRSNEGSLNVQHTTKDKMEDVMQEGPDISKVEQNEQAKEERRRDTDKCHGEAEWLK